MRFLQIAAASFAVALSSTIPGHAGPCEPEIVSTQAEFDARLNARAAAGPAAPESDAATMHHQPTPRSVAGAEVELGDISAEQTRLFSQAIQRARAADAADDMKTCQTAIEDARSVLARQGRRG